MCSRNATRGRAQCTRAPPSFGHDGGGARGGNITGEGGNNNVFKEMLQVWGRANLT